VFAGDGCAGGGGVELLDLPVIALVLLNGSIVVCADGGGVPVTRDDAGMLHGAEAVVHKDLTTALLASSVDADVLLLTDVDAVQDGYGTPHAGGPRQRPRWVGATMSPEGTT
jgi:carbamate kinase